MNKPILVVLAAGMGSRYGGLKQVDPIGSNGEIIIDFSVYDAVKVGFEKVVFIIKKEIEKDFKESVGDKLSKMLDVEYVYQDINDLPAGFALPHGREKPWGTAHAVLACKGVVNEPFAVINADDFYGRTAFKLIYDQLSFACDKEKYDYSMVGFKLENTLTENGFVSRGVCEAKNGLLTEVNERVHIEKLGDKICYKDGEDWVDVASDSIVSLNLWGFTPSILSELDRIFPKVLENDILLTNPLKGEYFLPFVVDQLIKEGKATVKVLESVDKWYGVTYKEDKPVIMEAMRELQRQNVYPEKLWN